MQRLKLICEEKLYRHLDVGTAATTLVLAEQHSCRGLKQACIEFSNLLMHWKQSWKLMALSI